MRNPKVGDRVQVLQIGGVADLKTAALFREPQIVEAITKVPVDDGELEQVELEGCPYAVLASDVTEFPARQSFEDAVRLIETLPLTWKPAILKRLVETCGDAINCPVQFVERVVTEQTEREKD